jgi:serine/threonine-protein kinase HipA
VIHTDVHIRLPNGDILPCGEMVSAAADSKGAMRGAFRYHREYLDHPAAFSLDPNQLPLTTDEFTTDRPSGVHAVFEDAILPARRVVTFKCSGKLREKVNGS